MSELPQGWAEAPLPFVCTKITDGTHHSPVNLPTGDYKYVTAKNIRPWGLDLSDISFVDAKTHQEIYARCPVEKGDVLYIKDGATTGLAVVNPLDEPFSMLSSVALLKPDRQAIEPSYLKHWLNSPETLSMMLDKMTGTAIRRLTLTTISAQIFPLAPLHEQRRIVAKVDGLIARTARARKELDRIPTLIARYKQRLLALAFSGELTAGWRRERGAEFGKEVALGDVATGFNYGTAAKSAPSGKIPVLRMGNIQNGKLDWSNLVYTSDQTEIEKYRLVPGDVLFNRTNSPELVGKTALFKGEREAIYAGYLIRIRCSDVLLPAFLSYCLNAPAGRAYCWDVKTDGVSQSNINAKKIAAFRFLLPSVEEQAEIVHRIESAFGWLDRMAADHAAAARLLPKLDAAILAKAFRGELVPQDPNDEPAAKLLERIAAEREAAAAKPKKARGRPRVHHLEAIGITTGPPDIGTATLQITRKRKKAAIMSKSRQDDDVKDKPYLAGLLKSGHFSDAQSLFRAADLPVADFYKQLAWEIDKGHILDNAEELKAA